MSSKEIMAVLIPTGILALVWVIFESAVLKVVRKKGKSSDNKGKAGIKLKKGTSTDSIDSNIKPGEEIVESKEAFFVQNYTFKIIILLIIFSFLYSRLTIDCRKI